MPSEEQTLAAPKEETSWGMAVQELTPQLARQLKLEPGATGVVISDIKDGSPAAEAGLQPGDLISEVNRTAVKNLNDYQRALKQVKNGENLLLLIKRGSGALYVVLAPVSNN
jgi:serine protease Do